MKADPHVTRRVLSDCPVQMNASFRVPFRVPFRIAHGAVEVGPGDSFVIPSNAIHGSECPEAGRLIDRFTRDAFLL